MSTVLNQQDRPQQVETSFLDCISSLKGLGVFQNFSTSAEVPCFRQYNLIYGFNGTGKTTLSRVFSCLAAGEFHPELPLGGSFEVKLQNGQTVKSSASFDALKGSLLVFNVDFVEENLHWKTGTANPVVYIGKAQAALAAKLEEKNAELKRMAPKLLEANKDHQTLVKSFAEHKRNIARLIAENLGLGRKYDATNLVNDYGVGTYGKQCELSEQERHELKTVIAQETPLPRCTMLNTEPLGVSDFIGQLTTILDTTLGSMLLDDLREHNSMLKWIKEGIDYHQGHDLASCLFCGSQLDESRMKALEQTVDGKFDELTRQIASAKHQCEVFLGRISAIRNALPSVNDLTKALQSRYSAASEKLRANLSQGEELIQRLLAQIEIKATAPNIRVDASGLPSEDGAQLWEASLGELTEVINLVITEHNTTFDQFSKVQNDAREKLKRHFLAEGQSGYLDKEGNVTVAKTALDALQAEEKHLRDEIELLKQEVQQHGPAADLMNKMIHGYLGHKELEIGTMDDGYEIRRHGKPLSGSLSEGEKTAIALCYFLCTLEADGRHLINLIVVIDDPISSLDTKALNYAFSLIRRRLQHAGQLFILTHNIHFMNEVKKWLKNKTEKATDAAKATATLLFLDAVQVTGTEARSTSIKIMPKLIREYESEYHYLFKHVLDFTKAPDAENAYLYLMPNSIRKVLEIFLTFKIPGGAGLASKVEGLTQSELGIDPVRLLALDRLSQVESHGDNLDDLITFSSMTIEETKTAAAALFELIHKLDQIHFEQMCKLCK